jgi:Flp pilus assembly protein TadD
MMKRNDLIQKMAEALGRGDFAAAERHCQTLIDSGAEDDGSYLLGVLRVGQGQPEAALPLMRRAAQLMPERGDVAYNLGVTLRACGLLGEAVAAWRRAVSLAPQQADAWLNLALAVAETEGGAAALPVYRNGLTHHPADRDLLFNYGNLCHRRGDIDGAFASYQRLLEAHPTFVSGWINLAMTLKAAGNFQEAEEIYRQAIACDDPASRAVAHFNLANLLLLDGRWDEGFAEYEWRLSLPRAPVPPPLPEWTGTAPVGCRVLLWADQGMGDCVQFLRFVAPLAERGYRVFVQVRDELKTLVATAPGVVAAFGPGDALPEMECQLALGSLPHRLQAAPERSWSGAYLFARETMDLPGSNGRRRVGLVWAGNAAHANDSNRSIGLTALLPLLTIPGIDWYSLQVGSRAADLTTLAPGLPIMDLSLQLKDFAATAAAMAELDLIITVDTAAAHVGGAMGRPTWVMLPAVDCDWRWGASGVQSAWYPSLRLFRQPGPGEWEPVLAAMATLLSGG